MSTHERDGMTGVILAGGRGTRMGGVEKGLLEWRGRPLIAHLVEALAPQVDRILINANRDHERYAAFGLPLVADDPRHAGQGPLAGLHAALGGAGAQQEDGLVVCVPCDLAGIPADLVARLRAATRSQAQPLALAATGSRLHPTLCLLHRGYRQAIEASLDAGHHAAWRWFAEHGARVADFGESNIQTSNINTPDDLARLDDTPPSGAD